MASTEVRVGIVSWNTATQLEECLVALPAALDGLSAEVVVVDNASADGSAAAAESHEGVTVICNGDNVGYARGMNRALRDTACPVLIALNPDTLPPPGSLAGLVRVLQADPAVGLVAPQLVDALGHSQYTARPFPSVWTAMAECLLPYRWQTGSLGRHLLLEPGPQPETSCDVDWVTGAVHVIRASALKGRPPYDERWFMYAEDIELCWWLESQGWRRRFEPAITVLHAENASGTQAWGEDYEERCFDAIYDWYRRDVGSASLRVMAAVNAATARSRAVLGQLARRRPEHVANRARAARYHAQVARHGPSGPTSKRSSVG